MALYALWLLETGLAALSAYALTLRIARNRGSVERIMMTGAIATASILILAYTASLLGFFRLGAVSVAALAFHSGILAWAVRTGKSWEVLRASLRSDLTLIPRALREAFDHREVLSLLPVCFCAVTLTLSAFQIWFFPNWAWDCVWYHKPMTNFVIQTGSMDWVPTNIPHLNTFPRHTEMLAAWNVLLTGSTRLDDLPQLPLGLLGAVAVAAFCRRGNASPSLSLALGCVWLALPAIALQLQTTHADVAGAAFFLIAFYFLTDSRFDTVARWMTFLCLGLYAGSKGIGLFHFVLLLPLIVFRCARGLRREPSPGGMVRSLELLSWGAILAYPGLVIYARNFLRFGNPYWPLRLRIPLIGIELPGTFSPQQLGNHPPAFFAFSWENVQRMLSGWFSTKGDFFQDLREFPFGFVFPYLLLPALIALAALTLLSRGTVLKHRLSLFGLAVLAVLVPAAWWGRFTLALPAAGLGAYAMVYALTPNRFWRGVESCYLALLLAASLANMSSGYRVIPEVGLSRDVEEANSKKLREAAGWLWPFPLWALREKEFRAGDILLYDENSTFAGEFWTDDVRNRVEYRPQANVDPAAYVAGVDEVGARWLVVGASSPLEQHLRSQPERFQLISPLPAQSTLLYRVTPGRHAN